MVVIYGIRMRYQLRLLLSAQCVGVSPTNERAYIKTFCSCNRPVNHKQVKVRAIAGSMRQVMASLQPSKSPRYYTNKHATLTL